MSNTRKIVPPLPNDLRKAHLSQSRPVHIASGDIEGLSLNSNFDAASEAPSEMHSVVVVNDIGEMNVSRESFNEKELMNDDTNFQTLSISFYERKGQNTPHNKSLAAKNSLLAAIISPRNIYPARKVEKPKEILKEKTENNIHVPYFAKPLSSIASVNQSVLDKSSSLFSIIERNQSPSTKMLISSARALQPKENIHEEGKVLRPPVSHRGPGVNHENKKEISLIKEAEDYLVNRLEKKVKAQAQQNAQNKVLKFKGGDKKNLRLDLTTERVEPLQSEKSSLNSERTVFNAERQEVGVKKVGLETDRARLKTERSVEREKPMSKLRESSSKNTNRSMMNHANKIQSPRGNVTCLNAKVPKLFVQDKSVSKIKRDNDTTQNTTTTQSQNQSQNMNTSGTEGVPRRFIELTKNIFSEITEQVNTRKEDFNKNSSVVKKETSRERSETRLRSSSKKATKKSMLNSLMNPGKIIAGKPAEGSQKASPAKAKMQIVNRLPLHKLLNVAKSGDLRCVTSFRDSSCDNTQDQTFKTEKDEFSSIMGGLPKTTTNKASQGLRESLNGAKTTRNYQDDLTYGLGGFMSSRVVLGMNNNGNREKSLNKNVDTSFEFGFRPNTERGVLGKVNESCLSFDKRRGSKPNTASLLKDHSQDESRIVNRSSRVLTATGTEKKVQKNHQNNKENNHKVSFEHKHEKQNLNTSHGNGSVPGTCCKCGNPTKKNLQVQNAYYK